MKTLGFLGVVLALAACADDEASDRGVVAAGTGGDGRGGGGGCQYDLKGRGGAIHIDPVVPEPGSWCPEEGLELCTDRKEGSFPLDPEAVNDAGRPIDPAGVLTRCINSAWQLVADAECESPYYECNVFDYREYDAQCCIEVRNCERAFCDGTRWWTRR
jgi:hypothetical protein